MEDDDERAGRFSNKKVFSCELIDVNKAVSARALLEKNSPPRQDDGDDDRRSTTGGGSIYPSIHSCACGRLQSIHQSI